MYSLQWKNTGIPIDWISRRTEFRNKMINRKMITYFALKHASWAKQKRTYIPARLTSSVKRSQLICPANRRSRRRKVAVYIPSLEMHSMDTHEMLTVSFVHSVTELLVLYILMSFLARDSLLIGSNNIERKIWKPKVYVTTHVHVIESTQGG